MPEQAGGLGSLMGFLPLILMFALFYFLILRPQKKREREVQQMRSALQTGDEIVTIGGILGRIVQVKEDIVVIEVGSEKTHMEVLKTAIGTVSSKRDIKKADIDQNLG